MIQKRKRIKSTFTALFQFCDPHFQRVAPGSAAFLFDRSHRLVPDGAPRLEHVSERHEQSQKRSHLLGGGEKEARVNHHPPAVCDHTLVAAVFFVPFFALDGRVVAAFSHAYAHHRGGVAGAVHLHLHLKNERRVTLLQGSTCTPASTS